MALRLPPLPALRIFEAAGRHQSFKLASEELHLTASAVSHGIVALERWLGVELFERRPNGVVLNETGQEYFSFVSEALAMIAVGTRQLPKSGGIKTVSISLAPTFAARWLLPRLGEFRSMHPDIALMLDTSHRQVGFPVDDVDLAVRMARSPWPGLVSTRLFNETLVPVCSPDFLRHHANDGNLDLATVTLLQVMSVTDDWATWFEAAGLTSVDLTTGISFDTVHMATDAAIAGLGVAIGRRPLVDTDLVEGKLVEVAGPAIAATTGYWLVSGAKAEDRVEVAAFANWLRSACKSVG